jgi:uncharacterized membrane protein YhaH (DUF805 family)
LEPRERDYYLVRNGRQHGPISAGEFGMLVDQRHLRPDDLVWFDGMEQWTKAAEIDGLIKPRDPPPFPPHLASLASPAPAPTAPAQPATMKRQPVAKVPGGAIFISYRRGDARHAAGRLVDRLGQTFGREQLFLDTDSIEPGLNFVEVLTDKVEACDVLLAVIGPDWLDARNVRGERRLDSPTDFVRIEIEAALTRDVRVIPVLVDGARMPAASDLPPSLAPLTYRNAVRLEHERFGSDAENLIRTLSRIVEPRGRTAPAAQLAMGPLPSAAFAEPIAPPPVAAAFVAPAGARSMGPAAVEASEKISTKALLFGFKGRIGRGRYWLGSLVMGPLVAAATGALALAQLLGPNLPPPEQITEPIVLLALSPAIVLAIWMFLALSVKRCHDHGKSGWLVILALLPVINLAFQLIYLGFLEGDRGPNAYGPDPVRRR